MTFPYTKPVFFFGKVLLATTFVVVIPSKIIKFDLVLETIQSRGVPEGLANILLIAAIGCLLSGTYLLISNKNQIIGSGLLLLFLVPTTLIFHIFPFQAEAFIMNMGLIGGLLLLLSGQPRHKDKSTSLTSFKIMEILERFLKYFFK